LPKFFYSKGGGFNRFGEFPMRIAPPIFVGSIAVLAALASPVSAKDASLNSHANANAQAPDEAPSAPGCHAYQQAPDGSWVELTCHEGNESAPTASRGKSAKSGG
jgi:hypothetical protein